MPRGENKQSLSFRFAGRTVDHLRRRAREVEKTTHSRGAQTQLAERYINEGLRQDEHPLIHFRDGAAGRRPAILGSRLDVADLVTTVRQNDNSVEEAAAYLEIPVEQVNAAIGYYAAYKDEIDEEIRDAAQAAEETARRWRSEQEVLG